MADSNNFPLWYHYKQGKSDRKWIASRIRLIPVQNRYEVSREYERIFNRQGRDAANTYLNDIAKGHIK